MKAAGDLRDQVINLRFPEQPRHKWTVSTPTEPARRIELEPLPACTVEITIPAQALFDLAQQARRNRTGRATDGGIMAKVRR